MKLMLTVETFKSGDKNGVVWASATGVDAVGRRARAAFRDPREGDGRKRATAMIEQMTAAVPPGQDVADIRPIVECFGSWRERPLFRQGKAVMRGDEPATERYFEVASFNLLSGPALELRRTKQRASEVVDVVAAALESGDAAKAAETALEFLRLFSGRPVDELEDVDADEPDEAAPDAPAGPDAAVAAATDSAETVPVEAPQPDAPTVAEQAVGTVVEAAAEIRSADRDGPAATPADGVEAAAPVVEETVEAAGPAEAATAVEAAPTAEVAGDFESLVAAFEASSTADGETAAPEAAAPARAAPPRPDLGKAPPASAPAPRQPLPPRAPAVAPRPVAAAPAVRPASPAPIRPVVARSPAPQAAASRPAVQPAAQRPGGVQAPQRTAAPASEPRVAPTAAIAPPSGGYRRPEQGEDPEALAATHIARRQRPGMPQAVRPAPIRPGVR